MLINIYCDESCHLENDNKPVMVLGAMWCPEKKAEIVNKDLKQIKIDYGLSKNLEIKWNKVSPGNIDFYLTLVKYFFKNKNLHLRALIIPDKTLIKHKIFNQTHDDWYYKMYFSMLKTILSPNSRYCIYIDIKDTNSAEKVRKLHDVLCNNMYDFRREIIERVQTIRSDEVNIIQLTDLFIGAISYANRGLDSSPAKIELIKSVRKFSGYSLTKSTLYKENKVNIFCWNAQEVD